MIGTLLQTHTDIQKRQSQIRPKKKKKFCQLLGACLNSDHGELYCQQISYTRGVIILPLGATTTIYNCNKRSKTLLKTSSNAKQKYTKNLQ